MYSREDVHVRTHIFSARAAAVIVALFVPACSQTPTPGSGGPTPEPPHVIVDRVLEHRNDLSLTREQIDDLAALSSKLRRDGGRLQIAGLDRVPGKSVPRYKRVYRTRADAKRMVLKLLTPPQRLQVHNILNPDQQ